MTVILISIILILFDPFTFNFATCPSGWAGIIGTAVWQLFWFNASHVILNCFTCKLVFSPVNRTSFYLILLYPLLRLLSVSLLKGGGGAWVEFSLLALVWIGCIFSGGAFLCYGLSMVCRLSEEGGTPCQKRARPDWWYAPSLWIGIGLFWFFIVSVWYAHMVLCCGVCQLAIWSRYSSVIVPVGAICLVHNKLPCDMIWPLPDIC